MRLSLEGRLAALLLVLVAAGTALGAVLAARLPWGLALVLAWLLILPLALLALRRVTVPVNRVLAALRDGLDSLREHDYSLSLSERRRDELGELVRAYNRVGEALRGERQRLHQRELLLESMLESNPAATVLTVEPDTVLFANAAARELLNGGRRLERAAWSAVLGACVQPLRDALAAGEDGLFSLDGAEGPEIYHLSQRRLSLNGLPHRLILVRPLTRELNRQEVAVWKKLIRVVSHELNNSLAPIASLTHSARLVLERGEAAARLPAILDAIAGRTQHLAEFIAGYVQFARLPHPQPRRLEWAPWLARLRALEPDCVLEGEPPEAGWADPVQLEQALLNLVKNGREAGGPVSLSIAAEAGGQRLSVRDRGPGMSPEQMERALLPFYSTKPGGTGLGLPLCREIVEAHGGRLRLSNGAGGGLVVSLWLPGEPMR